jgi:predicted transcriptional regulator
MLSIRPDWCDLIVSGDKTVEIRKTRPRIETPFRCFIYQTGEYIPAYVQGKYSGKRKPGMVIAEFICDALEKLDMDSVGLIIDRTKEHTDWNPCMTRSELLKYTGGMKPYGWHISDLKVYDRPRPLSDFKRWKKAGRWETLERLERAPQSWCYVEGGLAG